MRTRTAERETFLKDIIITAVENYGYGWFSVSAYDPDNGTARIHEEEEGTSHSVNVETIARGIGVIRRAEIVNGDLMAEDGKPLYMSEGHRKRILESSRENDAGELDVIDALAVLECGLFGRVVYA